MTHGILEFEHSFQNRENESGRTGDELEVGPEPAHEWEVRWLQWTATVDFRGTVTDFESAEANAELSLNGEDLIATDQLNQDQEGDSDRILAMDHGRAYAPVEDQTNGTGAGGRPFRVSEFIAFQGDELVLPAPATVNSILSIENVDAAAYDFTHQVSAAFIEHIRGR